MRKALYIHDVTIWKPDGTTDVYGNDSYTREVIKGRWEDKQRTFTNTNGNIVTSNAEVFIQKSVPEGTLFKKGKDASVQPPQDAYKMEKYSEIPNLFGTRVERKVTL